MSTFKSKYFHPDSPRPPRKTKKTCNGKVQSSSSKQKVKARGKPRAQKDFRERLIEAVRKIPSGKVVTFGGLASLMKTDPRWVARSVRCAKAQEDRKDCPFYRVISSARLLDAIDARQYEEMKQILEGEGVVFDENFKVQMANVWLPEGFSQRGKKRANVEVSEEGERIESKKIRETSSV